MFINIITPSVRPDNLFIIEKSINIPSHFYRWIVVYDADTLSEKIPSSAEVYYLKDNNSIMGNAQRNLALSKVKEGWVYFNDDDTELHPDLWDAVKSLEDLGCDFISFRQNNKDGSLRLMGDNVSLNNIDSHNFMFHHSLLGSTRWVLNRYDADGVFAEEIYKKSKIPLYIPKTLSVYNSLK